MAALKTASSQEKDGLQNFDGEMTEHYGKLDAILYAIGDMVKEVDEPLGNKIAWLASEARERAEKVEQLGRRAYERLPR